MPGVARQSKIARRNNKAYARLHTEAARCVVEHLVGRSCGLPPDDLGDPAACLLLVFWLLEEAAAGGRPVMSGCCCDVGPRQVHRKAAA